MNNPLNTHTDKRELRDKISQILIKHSMPTRQVAIGEIIELIALAEKRTAQDIWNMINDIELKSRDSSLEEWKEYKHIRNAIVDKFLT